MTLFTVEHVYIAVNDSDVWSILVSDVTVLCVGRNGGVCYRSCDGRVLITNISSDGGAIGSLQRSVTDIKHIYCVWILTMFSSLDDVTADTVTSLSITLTVPGSNLNTICLKV